MQVASLDNRDRKCRVSAIRLFRPGVLGLILAVAAATALGAADDVAATVNTADTETTAATAPTPVAAPAHPAASTSRAQSAHRPSGGLDERVRLISKELNLDANQEAQVRKILLAQRADLTKLWNDDSIPAAKRVGTTQAISEQTAGRIRALLTDEQKVKYLKARPHDTPVGAPGSDVEKWITATQAPLVTPAAENR
jgi:hypothetical protein